jgi:hypothetical protein
LEEIPCGNLPKTILDAFKVTLELGLQYIWIDSLCIIQDNQNDVQREIAKMLDIYMNSEVTISAASTSHCNQGFLEERHGTHDGVFYLPLRVDEDTMGSILISRDSVSEHPWDVQNEQPINKRGWTLQEAFITPRLLIFTGFNMIWRCQTKYEPSSKSIVYPSGSSNSLRESGWSLATESWGYTFVSLKDIQAKLKPDDIPPKDGTKFDMILSAPVWGQWRDILRVYNKRKLSQKVDKLPALSAIARVFASHFRCHYLAGLWRKYLIYDLMWFAANETRPKASESGSPSWSWAAIDGEVDFETGFDIHAVAEAVDCRVTLVSDENPFGAVTNGELVIRGYLKELELDTRKRVLYDSGKEFFGEFIPDFDRKTLRGYGTTTRVWCLTIGKKQCTDDGKEWEPFSLLITESEDRNSCYRRLGYVRGGAGRSPFWWEQSDKITITIV